MMKAKLMKIVIISDSHAIKDIEQYKVIENADVLIHAGDSQLMNNELSMFDFYVRGNCDFDTNIPSELFFELLGKKFYLCHGHKSNYLKVAKDNNCDVVISGHTHVVKVEKYDGMLLLNPGSLCQSRCDYPESYMVIEDDKIYLKNAITLKVIKEYEWM